MPHTQTRLEFTGCAFTMNAWNLCRMFTRRGHRVVHLGVEGSTPECSEHVSLVSEQAWREHYGPPGVEYFNTQSDGPCAAYHAQFGARLREAIERRVDAPWSAIVCATWGGVQHTATRGLKQFVVESGIGYKLTWSRYRVFESYAWMHMQWGQEGRFDGNQWYDVVIPSPLNLDLFDYRPKDKHGRFLFLGRLNDDKGVRLAIEATKRAGREITICGFGDPTRFLSGNDHVAYHPPVGAEGRRKLLAEAAGFFCPTIYVEPFGKVACEAQASGTPVICTDWGAFPETVLHGVTGFRCRTMEQFTWAVKNVERIDPAACRRWAAENFGLERAAQRYEEYFQMLLDLGGAGWYAERPERTELDWLRRTDPAERCSETR